MSFEVSWISNSLLKFDYNQVPSVISSQIFARLSTFIIGILLFFSVFHVLRQENDALETCFKRNLNFYADSSKLLDVKSRAFKN